MFKNFFAGSALLAGGAGLIAYDAMNSGSRGKRFDPRDHEAPMDMPSFRTTQDLMAMDSAAMETGPADGRDPEYFRRSVMEGRGQSMGASVNATQPRLAIDPDSVRDLSASGKTTQAV